MNLACDGKGRIYLFAFNRNRRRIDWIDLFQVDLDRAPERIVRKIDNLHLHCSAGGNFRFAGGISILAPDQIAAYACGKRIGVLTPIHVFGSAGSTKPPSEEARA